jgi:hypothetical protein
VIDDFESISDPGEALEQFRVAYLDASVADAVSGGEESTLPESGVSSYAPVKRDQPNPVSHTRVVPGEPTGHQGQTRPRDTSPLSEKEAMLRYLRDGSMDLDTIALRHLVRQLGILKGDSRNE